MPPERKPRRKPKPTYRAGRTGKPIPKTAEEKMASDASRLNEQAQVDAAQARLRTVSRGAIPGRRLRAGGMDLARYDQTRYASDPFPKITTTGNPNLGTGGGTGRRRNTGGNRGTGQPNTNRNRKTGTTGPSAGEKATRQLEEAARRERERKLKQKRTDTGAKKKVPRPGGGPVPS